MKQQRSSINRRISRGRGNYSNKKKWKRDGKENKPKKDNDEEIINRASKIGGTLNQFDFVDSISSQQSYKLTDLTPAPLASSDITPPRKKTITSLKLLCALELAKNVQLIDSKLLDAAPWSIWKLVWLNILKFGQDSPSIYRKFVNKFHNHHSFKAHRLPIGSNDIRHELILASSIPGNRLHRFETVFRNIHLEDILQFINMWNPLVFMDLSLVKMQRDDYFTIFNINDLMVLNLSNHEIDNTIIGALCSSIKSGKLSKLKLLKIHNTRVTPTGILDLFKLSNSSSVLSCIETDIHMSLDKDGYVTGTGWHKLDKTRHSLICKLPLGLKLSTLIRQKIIDSRSINLNEELILDLMMVDEVSNDKHTTEVTINGAWDLRTKAARRVYLGETFVLNRKVTSEEKRISTLSSKPQPRKKQKRVQLNAKEFFCI